MAAAAQPRRYTPEEYLALEREAEYKSEYVNGCIYAMAGASRAHILITGNIGGELRARLRGSPCETYTNDMRVKVSPTGMYAYPDVAVVCEEPLFEDGHVDTLLNPVLIVEVLSASTEAYDRGDKFAHYETVPSLREYILVAQNRPRIERYVRQPDGQWLRSVATGLQDTIHLAAIGCDLPLAEVYERVTFPAAPDPAEPGTPT
jgi:Uma2 family endonuclease